MSKREIMQLTLNDVQKAFTKVEELINEPNSRLLSWEHCIKRFALFCEGLNSKAISVKDITKEKIDFLSLHLGFYLASWGMMRGSTELLDKDYKIHIPAVKVILKHCKLFGKDLLNNQTNVKELFDLEAELRASYVTGKEGGLKKVSDTLSTKIIMGTLGIVPAYDTQVINSLKKYGIATSRFNDRSLTKICEYFCKESMKPIKEAVENHTQKMKKRCPYYTNMKSVDTLLWMLGK